MKSFITLIFMLPFVTSCNKSVFVGSKMFHKQNSPGHASCYSQGYLIYSSEFSDFKVTPYVSNHLFEVELTQLDGSTATITNAHCVMIYKR